MTLPADKNVELELLRRYARGNDSAAAIVLVAECREVAVGRKKTKWSRWTHSFSLHAAARYPLQSADTY